MRAPNEYGLPGQLSLFEASGLVFGTWDIGEADRKQPTGVLSQTGASEPVRSGGLDDKQKDQVQDADQGPSEFLKLVARIALRITHQTGEGDQVEATDESGSILAGQ
jgi:hypothetical protein